MARRKHSQTDTPAPPPSSSAAAPSSRRRVAPVLVALGVLCALLLAVELSGSLEVVDATILEAPAAGQGRTPVYRVRLPEQRSAEVRDEQGHAAGARVGDVVQVRVERGRLTGRIRALVLIGMAAPSQPAEAAEEDDPALAGAPTPPTGAAEADRPTPPASSVEDRDLSQIAHPSRITERAFRVGELRLDPALAPQPIVPSTP